MQAAIEDFANEEVHPYVPHSSNYQTKNSIIDIVLLLKKVSLNNIRVKIFKLVPLTEYPKNMFEIDDNYEIWRTGVENLLEDTMVDAFNVNSRVTRIDLSNMRLFDVVGKTIASVLSSNNTTVKSIDLSHNYILADGMQRIATELSKSDNKVTDINFSHNGIALNCTIIIVEMLKTNTTITHVSMSCSFQRQYDSMISIAEMLAVNRIIKYFDLSIHCLILDSDDSEVDVEIDTDVANAFGFALRQNATIETIILPYTKNEDDEGILNDSFRRHGSNHIINELDVMCVGYMRRTRTI